MTTIRKLLLAILIVTLVVIILYAREIITAWKVYRAKVTVQQVESEIDTLTEKLDNMHTEASKRVDINSVPIVPPPQIHVAADNTGADATMADNTLPTNITVVISSIDSQRDHLRNVRARVNGYHNLIKTLPSNSNMVHSLCYEIKNTKNLMQEINKAVEYQERRLSLLL